MNSQELVFKLARLAIAAAWADGKLEHDEVNSLKDLLFNLPELYEEDWQRLQLYLESPVERDEADRLLSEVLEAIENDSDKALVIRVLDELAASDGETTAEEAAFIQQVKEAVNDRKTGLLADANSSETVFQAFLQGTVPTESANSARTTSESRRQLRLDSF